MSKRDILLLLQDMLVSTERIIEYTNGLTFDQFLEDNKTIDAVIRNFEVIGEASNRIVHDYFGIDYEIVWDILSNYLDELRDQLTLLSDN